MKKIYYLLFLALIFFKGGKSQVFTSAFAVPELVITAVFNDNSGYIYVCGKGGLIVNYGWTKWVIRKYDPINTSLLWERTVRSNPALQIAGVFKTDKIFFGGTFSDSLICGPSKITSAG